MLANSYENAVNRVLILIFAMLFATSMGFNIQQIFDISNYKKLLNDTTILLGDVVTAAPIVIFGNTIMNNQPHTNVEPVANNAIQLKPVNKVDLQCLAENIYYEAGREGLAGKMAVGHVTLNRLHRPGYPKTVCGVINHRIGDTCMFSWKCSPQLRIDYQSRSWKESYQVAYDLLSKDRKDMIDITEGATHFHNQTVRPDWKMKRVARIGEHTFYRQ